MLLTLIVELLPKGNAPGYYAKKLADADVANYQTVTVGTDVYELLDAGASMFHENRRGETAADLAAAAGAEPLARLLQQHHAHRLAAGQREANVAQLVSQRLFDWACH